MKIYLSLLLSLFTIDSYSQVKAIDQNFDLTWNAKQVSSRELDHVLKNLSDNMAVEFIHIYPATTSIPQKDSSILVRKLKQLKFVQVSSGRGNWEKGPRMINYLLSSDRFVCRVDKLYYTDTTKPGHYIVTERIACLVKR